MSIHQANAAQWDELIDAIDRSNQRLADAMPTEKDALRVMFAAYERLKKLGWREAIYCPKDGSWFDSISAGSTGIHPCQYEGDWPKGSWWVAEAGDLWPAHPILFRASADAARQRAPLAPAEVSPGKHSTNPPKEQS